MDKDVINDMIVFIEAACERGCIKGNELMPVAMLRGKLVAELEKEEVDGSDEG